jgi:hypothetical protein
MNKRIIVCGALALASVVAIHAQKPEPGFQVVQKLRLEARVVKGLPYSAEIVTENIQTLADGNRIVQRTTGRVFRDSQGRVRREEDRPSGSPTISIMDPIAGLNISLDSALRTARETSTGLSIEIGKMVLDLQGLKADVERRLAESTSGDGLAQDADQRKAILDAKRRMAETFTGGGGVVVRPLEAGNKLDGQTAEKLQDRLIEGVLASGVRRTTTILAGAIGNEQPIKIVSEEWTSPDLQILVMTDRTDPRVGHSTYRLLKIVRSDPDPALFQVPADYAVSSPEGRGSRGTGPGLKVRPLDR